LIKTNNMDEEQVKKIIKDELFRIGILGKINGLIIDARKIELLNGSNISVNKNAGTQIGKSATEKLSFLGKAPIVQPTDPQQAALTDSTGSAYTGTLGAVSGSGDDGQINENFKNLYELTNEIRTALVNLGLIKGS